MFGNYDILSLLTTTEIEIKMSRIIFKNLKDLNQFPRILSNVQCLRGYQCDGKVYGYNALAWKEKRESSRSNLQLYKKSYLNLYKK